jgi:hypothetical protein
MRSRGCDGDQVVEHVAVRHQLRAAVLLDVAVHDSSPRMLVEQVVHAELGQQRLQIPPDRVLPGSDQLAFRAEALETCIVDPCCAGLALLNGVVDEQEAQPGGARLGDRQQQQRAWIVCDGGDVTGEVVPAAQRRQVLVDVCELTGVLEHLLRSFRRRRPRVSIRRNATDLLPEEEAAEVGPEIHVRDLQRREANLVEERPELDHPPGRGEHMICVIPLVSLAR